MNRTIQPGWMRLSERAYSALLVLYPASYRRDYGDLMCQLFRDVSRERYHAQGWAGIFLWWCATLLDLTVSALEQRRQVRLIMNRAMLIRWSGMLLVFGGAFSGLAAFSQLQPDDHYTYYGLYQVAIWLLAPGYLLIGLGCYGLGLRYAQALGTLGRWLLSLTGIGALMMAAGIVGSQLRGELWYVWLAGGIAHFVALTLFGLHHLRMPALPAFRGLPLMMAGGWLFMMVGGAQMTTQMTQNTLSFLIILGQGLAWLAIGLAVNRPQIELPVTA